MDLVFLSVGLGLGRSYLLVFPQQGEFVLGDAEETGEPHEFTPIGGSR